MTPFSVSIYPELEETGGYVELSGVLDEPCYYRGDIKFDTPKGIAYNLQLSNTGEAILLTGTVSTHAHTICDRCLEPAKLDVEGEAEGYYLLEKADQVEGKDVDEFDCVDEKGNINLSDALLGALVYATPFVVLCKEDCKGLCPHCGANLNEGSCSCDADDDIDPLSPFAALKDFKFDNN